MPPAPISRSSTYFPKTWGNIACRSGALAVLCLNALGCGSDEPEIVTRTLTVYSLPACAASASAELEIVALGPFEPTNSTAELLALGSLERDLPFPAGTRAIAASVSDAGRPFIGYGELRSDAVDLLLWPEASSCRVFDDALGAGFPGRGGGQALGYSARHGLVLAAGGDDPTSSAVVGALSFDVDTGEAYPVDAARRHVLGEPRAFATVTEFGAGLLVAGGEDPIHDVAEEARVLRDTAEIYDPATRRFELELVALREARTRHAALVLPSGETLLVGGRGAFGTALRTLETVNPGTGTSSLSGVATLEVGRIEPVALRLSDGRLFVGGGYDAENRPVAALERLDADAARHSPYATTPELPGRFDRAFVAMPGGAVLAVGGCEERAPEPGESCAMCRRGCPPERYDAWWIDRDGGAVELELDFAAPRPLLLPGSDGSPWLFVDTGNGTEPFRFNPFGARFERVQGDLGELPDPLLVPPVAVAADHFVWVGPGELPALVGFRGGTRGRFANDVGLVTARHPLDPGWPEHLVPDRMPSTVVYAAETGVLELVGGDAGVYVADALYGNVEIEITIEGEQAPLVVFGETAACAFPSGAEQALGLRRVGAELSLTRGSETSSCAGPLGELAIGLRAPDGAQARVTALSIQRLSP